MKCDELKAYKADVTIPVYGTIADAEVYLKDKADAAIATLRGANDEKSERIVELQKQVDELKAKLNESEEARYEAGADAADYYQENRKLKRALYKACDNWAVCEMDYWRKCLEHYEDYFNVRTDEDLTEEKCERMIDNWRKVAHNCRAKAEEYK
ncbi:MAG: hypothetical protein IKP90_05025 [Fibrobacter sp.]|nr:hypothetical protein [Fibrobacter sp.]